MGSQRGGVLPFLLLALTGVVAAQAQDVTPPALVEFSFTPTSVDVTAAPATVTVTAHITDDLAGFQEGYVFFFSPSGYGRLGGWLGLQSGTAADGVYQMTFQVPQFVEAGNWTAAQAYLCDKAGNVVNLGADRLSAAGFPTTLFVVSQPDTQAPALVEFSFTPTSVDVIAAPATVTVTARITDDPAGFQEGYVFFFSPSGHGPFGGWLRLQSGTAADGVYQMTFQIPQFAETGVWTATQVYLCDKAGNVVNLGADRLSAAGFPTRIIVRPADPTPPVITYSVTGTQGSGGWYTGNVKVTWQVVDPESGIASSSGCETTTLTADAPAVSLSCTATNGVGLSTSKSVTLGIDKTPPNITCSATPSVLWPPNGKMSSVTVSVGVTDGVSGPAGFTLVSVTSNEPPIGDSAQGFAVGTASVAGLLRAQRLGSGSDRVYSLVYQGKDRAGNKAACTATVTVPHDQGK